MLELRRNQDRTKSIRDCYGSDSLSLEVYRWASNIWGAINQRCVNGRYSSNKSLQGNPASVAYKRKKVELRMTAEEFHGFIASQISKYEEIRKSGEKPSIDRIDDDGHYELSNIRLITATDNMLKRYGREGDAPKKHYDPMTKTLANRKQYIAVQSNFKPMAIDYYLNEFTPKIVLAILSREEINALFVPVEETIIDDKIYTEMKNLKDEIDNSRLEKKVKVKSKIFENSKK